jgi:hypothetical protein
MDIEILRKLSRNPFYRFTEKQKAELAKAEQALAYGQVPLHNQELPKVKVCKNGKCK